MEQKEQLAAEKGQDAADIGDQIRRDKSEKTKLENEKQQIQSEINARKRAEKQDARAKAKSDKSDARAAQRFSRSHS